MITEPGESNMCINKPRRRGAVLPLTAILLIFLMGMVAFSVDLGYICMTQGQLQTAADAAALAGAAKLIKPTTQSSTSQDFLAQQAIVNAKAESIRFAKYNLAAGTYLDVLNQD